MKLKIYELVKLGLREGVPELKTSLHSEEEIKSAFNNIVKETIKSLKEEFGVVSATDNEEADVLYNNDKKNMDFWAEAQDEMYEVKVFVKEHEI